MPSVMARPTCARLLWVLCRCSGARCVLAWTAAGIATIPLSYMPILARNTGKVPLEPRRLSLGTRDNGALLRYLFLSHSSLSYSVGGQGRRGVSSTSSARFVYSANRLEITGSYSGSRGRATHLQLKIVPG